LGNCTVEWKGVGIMKIQINEGQYAYVMAQIALMNAEVAGMHEAFEGMANGE
jgi:hypothetical protein